MEARDSVSLNVEIKGIDDSLKKNALSYMEIDDLVKKKRVNPAVVERLHDEAPGRIRSALKPLGYYDPTINSNLIRNDRAWKASYEVKPGTPVRVKSVRFEIFGPGQEKEYFQKQVNNFPLKKGDILHQGKYSSAKSEIMRVANRWGYLDAVFRTSKIKINQEKHEAHIILKFNTGKRYRFGTIRFTENNLSDSFLRRFLILKQGEPYHSDRLNRQEQIFSNTDYFRRINIETKRDTVGVRTVSITIDLTLRRKHELGVGVGFGTNTGPRLRFDYKNRMVNKWGHQFSANAVLSAIQSDVTARYTIPLENPRTDSLSLFSSYLQEDPESSESQLARFGVTHSLKHDFLREVRSIEFRQEDFKIAGRTGHSTLLVPKLSISRTYADEALFPMNGYQLEGTLLGAHEEVGSDQTFIQFQFETKYIHALSDKTRLILQGDFGVTDVTNFRELPPTFRFFAGGDESVRGYAYESLGPRDSSGDVIGGEYLLTGSIELDNRIYQKWNVAAFFDIGNALSNITNFTDERKRGAGIGIRWRSPIGPIRLDVARAIDKPDGAYRIHFVMGPEL